MADEQAATPSSFWRGTLVGFLFTALGGLVSAYLQHSFSLQEKSSQLFLDEKKDFVDACQVYLTQYRNWYSLMSYYTYRTTPDAGHIAELDSASVRPAFVTWRKEFDVAYGNLFLVSNNEFGIVTMAVSDSLAKALTAVMIPSKLTQQQREEILARTNIYFYQVWLTGAQQEIFQYNKGERRQKSIAEFQAEQQAALKKQADSIRVDDQMYKEWKRLLKSRVQRDSTNGRPSRLPSREEFGEMMHPR